MSSHLFSAVAALTLYPVYLYRSDAPLLFDALILAWFLMPLGILVYLCKTGNLAIAHLLSSINLALFVVVGASVTGGLQSFLVAWLVIVPLEAALSGNKKVIVTASFVAVISVLGLYTLSQNGYVVTQSFPYSADLLMLFGVFSALLFSGAIARTVQQSHEEAEHSIRKSELKYRLMADHATDLITVHNSKGDASFVSPACQEIMGVQPDKLRGGGLLRQIHISDRPIYMTALSNALNSDKIVSVEFRIKSSAQAPDKNHYIWVEMRCQAVNYETETASKQIIAVTRDISSQKMQEIALLDAREKAESANIAKTRFLANMSHELRTPLNAIIGFSDFLNMELYGEIKNEKYSDYARLINEAGEHLLSVVNNILDMSKIEVGNFTITPEPFELRTLLNSCCDMIEPIALENEVNISLDFDSDQKEFIADNRAVKQMVLNLLSNAIKFSEIEAQIWLRTKSDDDYLYIEVEDKGIGIAQEDLPKLCNPFVQADSSYKREHEGVGLGLSVVKGLAELHGGRLIIDSELGRGTIVRIQLPQRFGTSSFHKSDLSTHDEKVYIIPLKEASG